MCIKVLQLKLFVIYKNTIPNLQKKYDINYISIYWMIKIKSFERKACIG